jgi:hypothetical protein
LLEQLIDHVDGMLTFIADLTFEIIQKALGAEDAGSYLEQVLVKFNLKFESKELLLDACLLVLTIASYSVSRRPDICAKLDLLLLENTDRLISPQQPALIKSRFCLFLSFYLDSLFKSVPAA